MVDENIIEVEYSSQEIVHLVQNNDHMAVECPSASNDVHCDQDEECNVSTNKNGMECKVVHVVEERVGAHKLLDFIIDEGLESIC